MNNIIGKYTKAVIGDSLEIMRKMALDYNNFVLCLTDPPYNLNTQLVNQQRKDFIRRFGKTFEDNKVRYNDTIKNYEEFSKVWFYWAKRISKMQIFTFGTKNLKMWLNIEVPKDFLYMYKPNGFGRTCYYQFNTIEPILMYGDIPTTMPFKKNAIRTVLKNGFLRPKYKKKLLHPHPKELEFYINILTRLKPKSVLDPFCGSGTVLEACEMLKIRAVGIEINEIYKEDIKLRIKTGIKNSYIYENINKIKKLSGY